MKVLVISSIYPNMNEPGKGVFRKQQFAELSKLCDLRVISPIPFYKKANIPFEDVVDGIRTYYPSYYFTPKIFRSLYGYFFYFSLNRFVSSLWERWPFEVILTAWAYPDGFGSTLIAKHIHVPMAIMTMGSDINIHAKYHLRKKMIRGALNNADRVISVSNSLKNRMVAIGVYPSKIEVITNGINSTIFRAIPVSVAKKTVNLPDDRKVILFAGNLVSGKGAELLIEALPHVLHEAPKALLVIAGDGVLKTQMQRRVADLGLQENVRFVGRQPLEKIPFYMNASNVFCLPSASEGCPNVVLEALSCGVPVVASDIPPIVEALQGSPSARLFPVGNVTALSEAIISTITQPMPDKEKIRMSILSWQENAKILYGTLVKVAQNKGVA